MPANGGHSSPHGIVFFAHFADRRSFFATGRMPCSSPRATSELKFFLSTLCLIVIIVLCPINCQPYPCNLLRMSYSCAMEYTTEHISKSIFALRLQYWSQHTRSSIRLFPQRLHLQIANSTQRMQRNFLLAGAVEKYGYHYRSGSTTL